MALSVHVLRTELHRTISGLQESVRREGLARTGERLVAVAGHQLAFPLVRARRRHERFAFRGHLLPYTFARYNNSSLNERAVEISIANWFRSAATGRMLEVGNVLSHYGVTGHTVLDKFEAVPGVLNRDIVDFVPDEPFDTVIAISTLEHVGWDEHPRRPPDVFRAFDVVRRCVAPGGRLLVTVPIGYNEVLDAALRAGEVALPQESWLVRVSRRNEWVETDRDHALAKAYGRPYTGANGLYVGMILD